MDQALNAINMIGSKILFIFQIISVILILINLVRKFLLSFSKESIIIEVFINAIIIILIFSLPKIFNLVAHILETFLKS